MAELKALLKFDNISLSFGGITALKNVSFDVKENSITSIIGPNGAGKLQYSTVLVEYIRQTAEKLYLMIKKLPTCVPIRLQSLE